jgi:UDP-N-acetylglucosamine--N-acetylmuramyl-(pentapeptide) pyrophosphoryl-undecaprenol N-acetylglucosamine transferase
VLSDPARLASLAAHAAAAGSRDADERLAAIVEEVARR